ncbi:hypothetical protein C4D60_Mb02t08520 [Musa balbisiana]|uniref:Mitochondrial fission protein ELM1 n=1 Tax=Musa balbisiana TaxID=52838 RepID=A0A4V4H2J0_MUSBA|nr:hypothetical protein C4D60_Mb02t08520 [Musa balbisiana]
MRPIRLPEPPSGLMGMPEIFEGGVNVIRRAVVIGNGSAGSENQSLGLVRALGLSDKYSIHRVTRPRGGINEWLRWLPVPVHKVLDNLIRQIFGNSRLVMSLQGRKLVAFPVQNGGHVGLSSILEADAKKIASIARETFEKEGPLLIVASGRDTISVASSIKRLAPESVFVIQIQHPRSRLDRFDLVVTPRHDYYALTANGQQEIPRILRWCITPKEPPGRNVVLSIGALHQADSAALRIAATAWHDELAPLPKPLLVVNIGGPTNSELVIEVQTIIPLLVFEVKLGLLDFFHFVGPSLVLYQGWKGNCKYGSDLATQLVGSLQNVLASCGSVRISFSRRTPKKV